MGVEAICRNCNFWTERGRGSIYTDDLGTDHHEGACGNGAFQECVNLFRNDDELVKRLTQAEIEFKGNNKAPGDSEFTWTTHEEFGCKYFELKKQLPIKTPKEKELVAKEFKNQLAKISHDLLYGHLSQNEALLKLKELIPSPALQADIGLFRDCWSSACATGYKHYPSLTKYQEEFDKWLETHNLT